jgi:uncharacterized protein involved in outer membrane biogenesis
MKKLVIGLAALAVVAFGAIYLWSNLDFIARRAVEKYGSAATQTSVRLNGVQLSLASGEGGLSGLSVGNPPGFSAERAFYLGSVSVKLDSQSLAGNGPVVINEITVDKPQIAYEVTAAGDTNLQALERNAENYANSFGGGTPSGTAKGRKVIIKNLIITNGQIAISQPLLQGRQLSASLPPIRLRDIGKSSGGATPAEVARILLGTITKSASRVAAASLTGALGNIKDLGLDAGNHAAGLAGQAGSQLKSLLGK